MTFKTYLLLIFHALIVTCIVLSVPLLTCFIFYNTLPDWAVCLIGVSSAIVFTIYPAIKYIMYIGNKILKEDETDE